MHSFSHWQPFFYLFIYFRNPLHGFTVLNFLRIRRDTLNEYATVVSPTCRSSHSKYPPFLVAWVLFTRLRTKIVIYHCRALSRYIKNALSVKRLAKISTLLPHKTCNWTRLSVVKIAALGALCQGAAQRCFDRVQTYSEHFESNIGFSCEYDPVADNPNSLYDHRTQHIRPTYLAVAERGSSSSFS